MSKFYFSSPSGAHSDSDADSDIDNLPYPEALPRSDFLSPTFSAPAYLSTLSNRHQTLEDLRSDLRDRSQALSKELLDLVNTNYEQFLSLGADLKGGEEKIESVRVGLLGFKRGVEEVKGKVIERREVVDGLLKEKKSASKEIAVGRGLLEVDARLEELEDRLMVASLGRTIGEDEESWSDSEEEEDKEDVLDARLGGTNTKKLQRLVNDYRYVDDLAEYIGKEHPFILAQQSRFMQVRNTILLDLSTALKEAAGGDGSRGNVVKLLGVYSDLDAAQEAVKVLKDLKA